MILDSYYYLKSGQDPGEAKESVDASLSKSPHDRVRRFHPEGGCFVDPGDGGGADHSQGHGEHKAHEQDHQRVKPVGEKNPRCVISLKKT